MRAFLFSANLVSLGTHVAWVTTLNIWTRCRHANKKLGVINHGSMHFQNWKVKKKEEELRNEQTSIKIWKANSRGEN